MRIKWSGGSVDPQRDPATDAQPSSVTSDRPDVAVESNRAPAAPSPLGAEEVARVHVEPEDRLAFRVGVNILTLVLIGLAVYLVWRRFFAGG